LGPRTLYRSTDGGARWSSPFGSPDLSPFVNAVVADPARPGTWYLGCNFGILKSRDGGEAWELASQGLRSLEFVITLAVTPAPDALYAIGWHTFPLCGGPDCVSNRIFRSVDGANQWRRSRVPGLERFHMLHTLAVDPASPATVYAVGGGFFKSVDGGVSWTRKQGLRGDVNDLIAVAPGTLYAAVGVPRGRRIFKSVDAGATWTPAAGGLPAGVAVFDLAADPAIPRTLYAATSAGVYVTRNGGALWTAINDGLTDLAVWTVTVDPARPGVVYAGNAAGLFELSGD
jgi:photosystem II stability/assembly factor-like uncharacterized protein